MSSEAQEERREGPTCAPPQAPVGPFFFGPPGVIFWSLGSVVVQNVFFANGRMLHAIISWALELGGGWVLEMGVRTNLAQVLCAQTFQI